MLPKFSLKSAKVFDLEKEKEAQLCSGFIDAEAVYQPCELPPSLEERKASEFCKTILCGIAFILALVALGFGGAVLYDVWRLESIEVHSLINHRIPTNISNVRCIEPTVKEVGIGGVSEVVSYTLKLYSPSFTSTNEDLYVKESLVEFYLNGRRVGFASTREMSMLTTHRGVHLYVDDKVAIPIAEAAPINILTAQFTLETSSDKSGPWNRFIFSNKYTVSCDLPANIEESIVYDY